MMLVILRMPFEIPQGKREGAVVGDLDHAGILNRLQILGGRMASSLFAKFVR